MKHYFFDLDECLVDTSQIKDYRYTREGLEFITQHPEKVPTKVYDQWLADYVNTLHRIHKNVSIATNSPPNYARAILNKHKFSKDIPIYAGISKPLSKRFNSVLENLKINPEDAILIGDTSKDILTAHGCECASLATPWGEHTLDQIKKAEPSAIVNEPRQLEELIKDFDIGNIKYSSRKDPQNYLFFDEEKSTPFPEIKLLNLEDYHPVSRPSNNFSKRVLRFKKIKNSTIDEIREGKKDLFFHDGELKGRKAFKYEFKILLEQTREYISGMNLKGSTLVLPSPNSCPEYCYNSDPNLMMAQRLNKRYFEIDSPGKIFHRVYPKEAAHNSGARNKEIHYKTIGIKKTTQLPKTDNIIIFDDIITFGTQIRSLANILRQITGFSGNLYGLALGKTVQEEEEF